ncbi:uncharacterized protein A4U43_C08F1560 [Asparagus officinalis]|nr:uncharacterized protein A4U43_C08F1560 [Asparagus officinalis]
MSPAPARGRRPTGLRPLSSPAVRSVCRCPRCCAVVIRGGQLGFEGGGRGVGGERTGRCPDLARPYQHPIGTNMISIRPAAELRSSIQRKSTAVFSAEPSRPGQGGCGRSVGVGWESKAESQSHSNSCRPLE